MAKKGFKRFIKEAPISEPSKPKQVDAVRSKQAAEKDSLKDRQETELERARERDFQDAQAERERKRRQAADAKRAKSSNESLEQKIEEVLEVGTSETVEAYGEAVPGVLNKNNSKKD